MALYAADNLIGGGEQVLNFGLTALRLSGTLHDIDGRAEQRLDLLCSHGV